MKLSCQMLSEGKSTVPCNNVVSLKHVSGEAKHVPGASYCTMINMLYEKYSFSFVLHALIYLFPFCSSYCTMINMLYKKFSFSFVLHVPFLQQMNEGEVHCQRIRKRTFRTRTKTEEVSTRNTASNSAVVAPYNNHPGENQ